MKRNNEAQPFLHGNNVHCVDCSTAILSDRRSRRHFTIFLTKCHRRLFGRPSARLERALAFPKSFRTTFSPCFFFFFFFFPYFSICLSLCVFLFIHPLLFGCSFHSPLRFPLLSRPAEAQPSERERERGPSKHFPAEAASRRR